MEGKDIAEIVISCFAAIGTLAAVVVALWQYKIQKSRRFKIMPFYNLKIVQTIGNVQQQFEVYGIDVLNIGFRDTTIKNWGVYISKKLQLQIVNPSINTAQIIKIEDTLRFETDKKTLYLSIMNNCKNIKNIEEKPIKFYITDVTGKMIVKKTSYKLKDLK